MSANVTSEKSLGRLLASQCDTSEVLGGARKRLGVVGEAREEELPAAGDLCGVAVRLGHPWHRLDQVVLEWGDVQSRSSICAMEYKTIPKVTFTKHRQFYDHLNRTD